MPRACIRRIPDGYEVDFHGEHHVLRPDGGQWTVDTFDDSSSDSIDNQIHNTLQDALNDILPETMTNARPLRLGRLHVCEPENASGLPMLAGNTWALDEQAGDKTSVDDFLQGLHQNGVSTEDLRQTWRHRGQPTSSGPCRDLIQAAVARALQAGFDAHDSETLTWIFRNPAQCDDHEDDCLVAALQFVARHGLNSDLAGAKERIMEALSDKCRANGKDDCRYCQTAAILQAGLLVLVPPNALTELANACIVDAETKASSQWDESAAKDYADELDEKARCILGLPLQSCEEE